MNADSAFNIHLKRIPFLEQGVPEIALPVGLNMLSQERLDGSIPEPVLPQSGIDFRLHSCGVKIGPLIVTPLEESFPGRPEPPTADHCT